MFTLLTNNKEIAINRSKSENSRLSFKDIHTNKNMYTHTDTHVHTNSRACTRIYIHTHTFNARTKTLRLANCP